MPRKERLSQESSEVHPHRLWGPSSSEFAFCGITFDPDMDSTPGPDCHAPEIGWEATLGARCQPACLGNPYPAEIEISAAESPLEPRRAGGSHPYATPITSLWAWPASGKVGLLPKV